MSAYEALLLADGDRVVAAGRVVAQDGATWLDPPLPVHAVYYSNGGPVYRATDLAVPLVGADLAQLPDHRERDGVLAGYAQITGSWQQDALICAAMDPIPVAPPHAPRLWRTPPCPEPVDGWPPPGPTGNLPVPPDTVPPDVGYVSLASFRPTEHTVAAVISATDTAAVEKALRPLLGTALCVVQARWTRAQVDQFRETLNTAMSGLGAYKIGEAVSDEGQVLFTMSVVRITAPLLALLDEVPADLVDLDVWLAPSPAGLPRENV